MSGSGDYTITPNLGLYKPNYALDVGRWGEHLNSNSDVLDAVVGAGAVNVLNFGADPTGLLDSSAAINQAAALIGPNGRNKAVYLPTGWYRVNHQIVLTGAQCLYGDSRGSSFLVVDQAFDPAASSVILLMQPPGGLDPGPVIRDLGITFVQPTTALTRAGFKTLAAGGTAGPGGTGVKYPWAIAAGAGSMRAQIIRVRIGGAWDGITTNNNNVVLYLEDLELGALDCGISMGEGTGVLDSCHIQGLHFWNFDLSYAGSIGVFTDGQTIALRLGRVDGFDCRGFLSHCGRIILTSEATGSYIFTHLFLDTLADIEVIGGTDTILQINNMTSGIISSLSRPVVDIAAGTAQISNFKCNSNCNQPHLSVRGTADVTMTEINAFCWILNVPGVIVQDAATLRLSGKLIPMQTTGTYSGGVVSQNGASHLQISRLDVMGPTGTSGTAVQVNVDNRGNIVDTVVLNPTGWANIIVATQNGSYGPWVTSNKPIPNGLHFGTNTVTGTDLSKHISLYDGFNGFNTQASGIGVVSGNVLSMLIEANNVTFNGKMTNTWIGANGNYANDVAAASGGVAIGQLYRNGSVVMVRVA